MILKLKSPFITKDIDILKDFSEPKRKRFIEIEITITTLNRWKDFERNAPSPDKRFELIKELSDEGIYVRVMIMPTLGKYTDIKAIWKKAQKYGAQHYRHKPLNPKYYRDGLELSQLVKKYSI